MQGSDHQQTWMFSYISAERRVPKNHPLRAIRNMVDAALRNMGPPFDAMYAKVGRPSIAPEKLLRALLLRVLALYAVQRADADGAVGLKSAVSLVRGDEHRRSGVGSERVHQKSRAAVVRKNAAIFFAEVLAQAPERQLLSSEDFTVDGTSIEASQPQELPQGWV